MAKQLNLKEAQEVFSPHYSVYHGDDTLVTANKKHVFDNSNGGFSVADFGSGSPHMTFIVPNEFHTDSQGNTKNPLEYREFLGRDENGNLIADELISGFDLDFKHGDSGKEEIMFGDFRMSRSGKPVFELQDADKADHILIHCEVDYDDYDDKATGLTKNEADNSGAVYYDETSDDGEVEDVYVVLPVNSEHWNGETPIHDLLSECRSFIDTEIQKDEDTYQDMTDVKETVMERIEPVLEQIRQYDPGYKFEVDDEGTSVKITSPNAWRDIGDRYSIGQEDEIMEHLKKDLGYYEDRQAEKDFLAENGFDVDRFDVDQRYELAEGFREGLTKEQVEAYAFTDLKPYYMHYIDFHDDRTWLPPTDGPENQMEHYRNMLLKGSPTEVVRTCAEHGLEPKQADAVLDEVQNGIPVEKAERIADSDFTTGQIHEIGNWIRDGIPDEKTDHYFDTSRSVNELKEIRLGINEGLSEKEIDFYTNPHNFMHGFFEINSDTFSTKTMGEIRTELVKDKEILKECGIDSDELNPLHTFSVKEAIDSGMDAGKLNVLVNSDLYDEEKTVSENRETFTSAEKLLETDISAGDAEHVIKNSTDSYRIDLFTDAVKNGMDSEQIRIAEGTEFDDGQVKQILDGFEKGLSIREVSYYADAENDADYMETLKNRIIDGDPKTMAAVDGYPRFEARCKTSGLTWLGMGYVIEKDGTVREPDGWGYGSNTRSWQLLPGDAAVKFEKDYTADPYHISFEWKDGELTDAQKAKIESCLSGLTGGSVVGRDGEKVEDIKDWMNSADFEPKHEYKNPDDEKPDDDYLDNDNSADNDDNGIEEAVDTDAHVDNDLKYDKADADEQDDNDDDDDWNDGWGGEWHD